jgi:DNA (cytosine-5)-methyltransferase 1
MDQMRIVKEMRERERAAGRTGEFIRPRYMVWENVEGAKTSPGGNHRGEDFAAVLEEIIRVGELDADIHVRVPDGGWPNAGCYFAEDGSWSLAWRLVDAQFFGTPQRRKRIALLADFAGLTAPEILFDPQLERATETGEPIEAVRDPAPGGQEIPPLTEGVSWDSEQSGAAGEGTSCGTESGAGSASYTLKIRGGVDIDSAGKRAGKGPLVQTELSGTLGVSQDQTLIQTAYATQASGDRDNPSQSVSEEIAYTLPANPMSDRQQAVAYGIDQQGGKGGANYTEEISPPILSDSHGTPHAVCGINGDIAGTLDASYYKGCGERQGIEREVVLAVDCRNGTEDPNVNGTLQAKSNGGWNYNSNNVVREKATPYGICSYESNAFKSSNPHSAIYKADTARTLDNNGGNPACNQGGIAVVDKCYPIEGNGARPSHFGSGYGKDGDPSFTLNHVEQHGVATYDARGNGDGNIACTLTGDHQDRVTDYTALVVENDSAGE